MEDFDLDNLKADPESVLNQATEEEVVDLLLELNTEVKFFLEDA